MDDTEYNLLLKRLQRVFHPFAGVEPKLIGPKSRFSFNFSNPFKNSPQCCSNSLKEEQVSRNSE
jgi:hypothetical protein